MNKNFPDVVKALGKSDEFAEAAKKLSQVDNLKLTQENAKVIEATFEAAGMTKHLIKTSTDLPIKETIHFGSDVWTLPAVKRGDFADEFLNHHTVPGGNSLGKTFPVADRVQDMTLISTKTLDVGAQSYQRASALRGRLNRCAESLKGFEKKYMGAGNSYSVADKTVKRGDYNKKALEIVIPDIPITEDCMNVMKEFKETIEKSGIEVWFIIGTK